ncbi:MAG: hypothetical protein KFKLKKLM_02461 [Flavobacteriales bacterium]|nr:hypothetical protein [Flavobacteriales bacterium]
MDNTSSNIKSLTNEQRLNWLKEKYTKNEQLKNKLTLMLILIIGGYMSFDLGVSTKFDIGLFSIEDGSVIILLSPILFSFILLKAYSVSVHQIELRDELRRFCEEEYGMKQEEYQLLLDFDFVSYLSKPFGKLSNSWNVFYVFLLILPLSLTAILIPLIFQVYVFNNLLELNYENETILFLCQLASILLITMLYAFMVNRSFVKVLIEAGLFNEEERKHYSVAIWQTIFTAIVFFVVILFFKVDSENLTSPLFSKSYDFIGILLIVAISGLSSNGLYNGIRSLWKKESKKKWFNFIIMLISLAHLTILCFYAYGIYLGMMKDFGS